MADVTRRSFLGAGAAAVVVPLMPGFASACGGGRLDERSFNFTDFHINKGTKDEKIVRWYMGIDETTTPVTPIDLIVDRITDAKGRTIFEGPSVVLFKHPINSGSSIPFNVVNPSVIVESKRDADGSLILSRAMCSSTVAGADALVPAINALFNQDPSFRAIGLDPAKLQVFRTAEEARAKSGPVQRPVPSTAPRS